MDKLPSREMWFIAVDDAARAPLCHEVAEMIMHVDEPLEPRPLLAVYQDLDNMAKYGDELDKEAARLFDAYYDWILPMRRWNEAQLRTN